MPVRETFWNIPFSLQLAFYAAAALSCAVFAYGVYLSFALYARGRRARRKGEARRRLPTMLADVFLQRRVLSRPAGIVHAVVFVSFVLMFLGTALATIDWDVTRPLGFRLLAGDFYLAYKTVLEAAGVFGALALAAAIARRLAGGVRDRHPAVCLLMAFLVFIIVSGFFLEALRIASLEPAWACFTPVGKAVAQAFLAELPAADLLELHAATWCVHGASGLLCVAMVPFGFLEHVYKVPVSVFWRKLGAKGALEAMADMELAERFGASVSGDLADVSRIAIEACTGCARCTQVCPMRRAGAPLDPRRVVEGFRKALEAGESAELSEFVSREAVLACTTCGACAGVCPAHIDIPGLIVEVRRHLALEEGDFAPGVRAAVERSAATGNPFGEDPSARFAWAEGLELPFAEEGTEYEYLFWVGCQASYDPRARGVARAMVRILRASGVSFACMRQESCLEDFARRAGEEYVFATAAAANIENLRRYRFGKIVAVCPHCANTLKNEYPAFGANFEVLHHTAFIAQMLEEGRLKLKTGAKDFEMALHDPCYLTRLNDGGGDFRRAAAGVPGARLVEPAASGEEAFCCGAGGSQYFAKSGAEKAAVIRIRDLTQKTGCVATACPFCLTMLDAARPAAGSEAQIEDVAVRLARELAD